MACAHTIENENEPLKSKRYQGKAKSEKEIQIREPPTKI
jgi:hypothetical protein